MRNSVPREYVRLLLLCLLLLQRPGAFAIYLEPWHADIFDFLDAKKNTGALPGAVKMA